MKRLTFCLACLFLAVASSSARNNEPDEQLRRTFANPSGVTTSCYWYWISGNISREGVVNDLKAMKKAGINRAFIGNQGVGNDEAPRGPVRIQSAEWYDIMHTAMKTASREGIEIGLFNGPGWSQAGGPWNKKEQSMRYLASQHAIVKGGGMKTVVFPHPSNWLQNVRLLAFPHKRDDAQITAQTDNVTALSIDNISALFDGSPATTAQIASKTATVYITTAKKNFHLRSLRIEIASPVKGYVTVSAERNGTYETVKTLPLDRTNMMIEIGYDVLAPIAMSLPESVADKFRLDFHVTKPCTLREITLAETPVVDQYPEKNLGKMVQVPLPMWNEYKWKTPVNYTGNDVVAAADVIDLSSNLHGDTLAYAFPDGTWEVVRTYMAPTMIMNAPTLPDDGRGPEVDRWNHDALKNHYDSFVGDLIKRIPADDRTTWKVMVCDSYEKATQNFGDDFFEYFRSHFGYDPTPYLLAYDGIVVESSEKTDRFLWDLRRMIADRLAYDHIGALRDLGHRDGLSLWLETYGHWGFPGEFLQYGGQSDEVAGEFWSEGSLGDIENRAASSVAHIYGKDKVSSESFTCGPPEFTRSPRNMKQRGDKFFTEGVNNTLLHVVISQPEEKKLPGLNCPWGQEFNRKNTWYSHLDLFTTYLKRCNYMLQQGRYVADVAYFIGEDAPVMTGITDPQLPKGYQFDFINAEVIEGKLTASADHLLTLPYGNQYKLLVLPPLKTMRPAMIRRIRQLLYDGAVVLGPKPLRSPSLKDWGEGDAEVRRIADELWGEGQPTCGMRHVGKGLLFTGYSIDEVFRLTGNTPDVLFAGAEDVKFAHLTLDDMDVFFVSNQTERQADFVAQLRITGRQPELWTPIDGRVRVLRSFSQDANITSIPMRLAPNESVFLVFKEPVHTGTASLSMDDNFPVADTLLTIDTPWRVELQTMFGEKKRLSLKNLVSLTTSTDRFVKYFSGTATYKNTFNMPQLQAGYSYLIDLSQVYEMAKVKINGHYAGGVWTPPYTIDMTPYLKKGRNEVEITVVNNWKNRIIGDLQLPENERKTSFGHLSYGANTPLQNTGLIGPVRILETREP